MTEPRPATFPKDFLWGSASASYQLEGAWDSDGRLPSIWDTFAHTPGRIHLDQNADVSTDHYHRYQEDVELMRWMGMKAYRFSISWSRVMDARSGRPNPAGLAFYHRLIDALLAAGIQPWITCFHWDLPQSLEDDHGGWRSRLTAEKFADYCTLLSREYSDKVTHWFTINEFWNITDAGYVWGVKAPGHQVDKKTAWEVRWNTLLAHGLGLQALRSAARQPLQIGVAEAYQAPIPLLPQREDYRQAALAAGRDALFLRPIFEGVFSPWDEEAIERHGLKLADTDRHCVAGKLDFLGLNSYNPKYVRPADNVRGYEEIKTSQDHPKIGPDWLRIDPDILYWGPVWSTNSGRPAPSTSAKTAVPGWKNRIKKARSTTPTATCNSAPTWNPPHAASPTECRSGATSTGAPWIILNGATAINTASASSMSITKRSSAPPNSVPTGCDINSSSLIGLNANGLSVWIAACL
ncbi:MAG: family 1 glycosylhydrolase [Candidatus Competibacteraceae bacterium]|nr:family 1 glycosylhydrolase [Candidatus Competibacteraceae bacterium]